MKKITFLALALLIAVCAQAKVIDLSTANGSAIYAYNGDIITGTMAVPSPLYIKGTVVLDGVTIAGVNDSKYLFPGIRTSKNESATIVLKGTNIITGHYKVFPGIFVDGEDAWLTIEGDGTLIVSSNGNAAAIGAADAYPAGDIIIKGGNILATGGYMAAAIGGANATACGNITIMGGSINATGGSYAAGIGSGYNGDCGDITIMHDISPISIQVNAGAHNSYSIGKGEYGTCGEINVCGKNYTDGVTTSPFIYQTWDGNLANVTDNVLAIDGTTIYGTLSTNHKISIAKQATVTLRDATIVGTSSAYYQFAGLTCEGSAKIILEGKNKVVGFYSYYPGIFVPYLSELTIEGDGELVTWSNGSGAGIGGGYKMNCGSIVINGGTIDAIGGYGAAAIGGGNEATCENIAITECVTQVKATKSYSSASPYSVGPGYGATFDASILVGSDCLNPYSGSMDNRAPGIEDAVFIYPEPSGIDEVQSDKVQRTKVLRDGAMYIIHNGKTYTAQGAEVK